MHVLSVGNSPTGIVGSPSRNCCVMLEDVNSVCRFLNEMAVEFFELSCLIRVSMML